MPLFFVGLAFIAGVFFAGSIGRLPVETPWLLGALLLTALVGRLRGGGGPVALLALLLAAFMGGVWRYHAAMPGGGADALSHYNDTSSLVVLGRVEGAPEETARGWRLRLNASGVHDVGSVRPISGAALIYVPTYPRYSDGDLLQVRGELLTPSSLGEFDYRDYLARRGIVSLMWYADVELVVPASGLRPQAALFSWRERLAESLERSLPEPQASLAQGLLLGLRLRLPDSLQAAFRATGTTHIIVISGHNLSLVAGMVAGAGVQMLGRRRAFYPILLAVWLYALLVGGEAPVVRAAIMASLVLLAVQVGRRSSAGLSLVVAAAAMVGIAPGQLWDVSFQLSFLAMAGIMFLAPPLSAGGRLLLETRLTGSRGRALLPLAALVSDLLAASAGATLATLPIIAQNFGAVSLVGLPATLLVLPALPVILATSAITAAAGLLWAPLGQAAGVVAWVSLQYMTMMVELWSRLPFAKVELRHVPAGWVAAYYLLFAGFTLGTFLGWSRARIYTIARAIRFWPPPAASRQSPWLLGGLAVVATGIWVAALASPPDLRLYVIFLDVGQGDAILIRGPGDERVLVDGGRDPRRLVELLDSRFALWDRRLDLVISTHADEDHLGGLPEVLRRYRVKRVLGPPLDVDTPLYQEWREAIDSRGVADWRAQAGEQVVLGRSARLDVLNPGAVATGDANDDSVVLKLTAGGLCVLLTADVEQEGQRRLLASGARLDCQVLQLPHHGAAQLQPAFAARVRPTVAVVSVGKDNPYGHPSAETLSMVEGALVLRTDQQGTLDLMTDGRRLWVRTEEPTSGR